MDVKNTLLLALCLIAVGQISIGCNHSIERRLIRDEIVYQENHRVLSVLLRNGTVVYFDESGGRLRKTWEAGIERLYIDGRTTLGERREIAVTDIATARVHTEETVDGAGATVGTLAVVAATSLLAFFIAFVASAR